MISKLKKMYSNFVSYIKGLFKSGPIMKKPVKKPVKKSPPKKKKFK